MQKNNFFEDINGNLHAMSMVKYVSPANLFNPEANELHKFGNVIEGEGKYFAELRYYPNMREEISKETYNKLKSNKDFILANNGSLLHVSKIAHTSKNQYGNLIVLRSEDKYYVSDEAYNNLKNHTI